MSRFSRTDFLSPSRAGRRGAEAGAGSVDKAFSLIRAYARGNDRRLGDVARAVIVNAEGLGGLTPP
jgi:hypothetical protein